MLAAMLILVGCASGAQPIEYSDERDLLGNRYPVDCVAQYTVHPRIALLPEDSLRLVCGLPNHFVYGCWNTDWEVPDGVIYMASELDAITQYETLKHEMCHAQMYRLTGSPIWHR